MRLSGCGRVTRSDADVYYGRTSRSMLFSWYGYPQCGPVFTDNSIFDTYMDDWRTCWLILITREGNDNEFRICGYFLRRLPVTHIPTPLSTGVSTATRKTLTPSVLPSARVPHRVPRCSLRLVCLIGNVFTCLKHLILNIRNRSVRVWQVMMKDRPLRHREPVKPFTNLPKMIPAHL